MSTGGGQVGGEGGEGGGLQRCGPSGRNVAVCVVTTSEREKPQCGRTNPQTHINIPMQPACHDCSPTRIVSLHCSLCWFMRVAGLDFLLGVPRVFIVQELHHVLL